MIIEPLVIARGAALALLLAVPAALANVMIAAQDDPSGPLLNLTLLVMLAGFIAGGFGAGHEATREAARHGALAGVTAFVLVQVIGILGRLDRGDDIALGSIIFLGLLAASAGTLGALVGARQKAGRARS